MKTIFALTVLLLGNFAHADMSRSTLFSLNTIYLDRDYTGAGASSKETDTDFRLTRIEKGWSYGILYAQSANDSSSANRTSYGLSVGYFSDKDFYLSYSYFYSSKYKLGNTEYNHGSGYEFDLGFLSKITSSFYAGLLFAIKNFSYTNQNTGGVDSPASVTHKEVIPMFSFGINFM